MPGRSSDELFLSGSYLSITYIPEPLAAEDENHTRIRLPLTSNCRFSYVSRVGVQGLLLQEAEF